MINEIYTLLGTGNVSNLSLSGVESLTWIPINDVNCNYMMYGVIVLYLFQKYISPEKFRFRFAPKHVGHIRVI